MVQIILFNITKILIMGY